MAEWPESCTRCKKKQPIVGWGKEYLCQKCLEIRLQERLGPVKKLLWQVTRPKFGD